MDIEQSIEESHRALVDFAKGNPEPCMAIYSQANDATLANPFGYTVRGWAEVSAALSYAASRFRDGDMTGADRIAMYQSSDIATVFEIEHWQARVGDSADVAPFELRVSTTWRREDAEWKIVHRHADPINAFDDRGPLRNT